MNMNRALSARVRKVIFFQMNLVDSFQELAVGMSRLVSISHTPAEIINAIISDEHAISIINNKTTAVRVIPAPGKKAGESVDFGGLLGEAPITSMRN